MNLRAPQAKALEKVRDALLRLPKRLAECTPDITRSFLLPNSDSNHSGHAAFTIALATGVGKTRLAGAIMAMLWLSGEARTFLMLAPRRAVLRRLVSGLDPKFREYIFIDQNLLPEPHVVQADEIDTPRAVDFDPNVAPVIFVLSQQIITTSDRFRGKAEFADRSLAEVLRTQPGLVAIVDEAHHVGRVAERESTAWAEAIRDLDPVLQIGLTATPRRKSSGEVEAGVNLLYEYPLREALEDGLYTKKIKLLVRHFESTATDEDIDRVTVDYVLDRLGVKAGATASVEAPDFPSLKPVAVLFAEDIGHAQRIYDWVVGTERLAKDQVLLTHSRMSKSDEELERLLSIEDISNPVRLVINVMELSEGWDVTNVYVIAPLRAMATFSNAVQVVGRGLRLPAGRRVGNEEADTLDVVCFGRQRFGEIMREATEWTGRSDPSGGGVTVRRFDRPGTLTRQVTVEAVRPEHLNFHELTFEHVDPDLDIRPEALKRVTEAVVQGFELRRARLRVGAVGTLRLDRDRFIQAATTRTIRRLSARLSDVAHFDAVSKIIGDWLDVVRPGQTQVDFDPQEVGEELALVIDDSTKAEAATYLRTEITRTIEFPGFRLDIDLDPDSAEAALEVITAANMPIFSDLKDFKIGQPYSGWQRSVHDAYSFDSSHEALLAKMLDSAADVDWWLRNQPRRFRLRTPVGLYSPDFIAILKPGVVTSKSTTLLVEVKGDVWWAPADSPARLNAASAKAWCAVQSSVSAENWAAVVALESDIEKSDGWPELKPRLQPPL